MALGKLYTYGTGISCMKACMEILGICQAYPTSPLVPVSEKVKGELRELLAEQGLI